MTDYNVSGLLGQVVYCVVAYVLADVMIPKIVEDEVVKPLNLSILTT